MKLKVLVSIINWNNSEATIHALHSVLKLNHIGLEILLIDNNSIDNSVVEIKKAFPQLQIICSPENLGYAGGHKLAADFALNKNFDIIWILNNDVEVNQKSLSCLLAAYQRRPKAIFGSVIVDIKNQTISYSGGAEIIDGKALDNDNKFSGQNYLQVKDQMKERMVTYLHGASMLIPVNIIKEYGFMRIDYFLYNEETEYCLRLFKENNIPSIIVPDSYIYHKGSDSYKKSEKLKFIGIYYSTRNEQYLIREQLKSYTFRYYVKLFLHICFYFARYPFIRKKNKQLYYKNLGILHSLIGIRGKYFEPNDFI